MDPVAVDSRPRAAGALAPIALGEETCMLREMAEQTIAQPADCATAPSSSASAVAAIFFASDRRKSCA